MFLSRNEIQNISQRKTAVNGRIYEDIYHNQYKGLPDGTLILYYSSGLFSSIVDTTTIDLDIDTVTKVLKADLKNTTVTAGTYGSAVNSPQITFDAQGRATSVVDVPIAIPPGVIALTQDHILVGSAANIATDVAMSGEAVIVASGAITLANSAVIGKVLTGFISGAGVVGAADSILQAIEKLDGNIAAIPGIPGLANVLGVSTNGGGLDIVNVPMLRTSTAVSSVDVQSRLLFDSTPVDSLSWETKQLKVNAWSYNASYAPYAGQQIPDAAWTIATFAPISVTNALTATYVGFGSAGNVLTGTANLIYDNANTLLTNKGTIIAGDVGGFYSGAVGAGNGTVGFNSTPDGGYLAGVNGYGSLMQLDPATGIFSMFLESNVLAGAAHGHTTTLQWDSTGKVRFPVGVLLGTLNTTLGNLGFYGSTSGLVTIQSKAIAGSWTMTLPDGVGGANQFLQTDGAGITSWATALTSVTAHNLLSVTHGDTLADTVVLGDVVVGNATPKWSRLVGQITATKKFLTQTGTGAVSAVPVWDTIAVADVPTLNQNTTGTANIAGGTLGAIPYQSGVNATTVLAATATAGQMLRSGASAAPTWSTNTFPNTTPINQILHATAANVIGGSTTLLWDTVNSALIVGRTTLAVSNEVAIFEKNQNSSTDLRVSNTTAGTAAYSQISCAASAGTLAFLGMVSGSTTTSGLYVQGVAYCSSNSAVGMSVGLSTATPLSFWTNNTKKVEISSVGNMSLGGVATRATVVGTNAVQIFDGTAPTGTLTNGGSIYSAAGQLFAIDSAGVYTRLTNTTGTAPATNAIGIVVDYYGTSATRVLTTPNDWMSINMNGTTYKIPLYS